MNGYLEDELYDVIRRYCADEDDREKAKNYFKDMTVAELIDDAFEE